jgi:type I restriction enzyme M protein
MNKTAQGVIRMMNVTDILKGSDYALTIFTEREVKALELFDRGGKPYITCAASDKSRPAKPEEIVRQLYLRKLMRVYGYPKERIAVEKPVYFGSAVHEKAADIVVWEKDAPTTPYIIVEVKKPKRKDGLEQLKSYCNAEGSPIGVWTNGSETIALHREEPNIFRNLPEIPSATQRLAEMLAERWTLEDLEKHNKLVTERRSLKSVILDMENLVLANAGVDAFDEVFKLVYAKLFDEWQAGRQSAIWSSELAVQQVGSSRKRWTHSSKRQWINGPESSQAENALTLNLTI